MYRGGMHSPLLIDATAVVVVAALVGSYVTSYRAIRRAERAEAAAARYRAELGRRRTPALTRVMPVYHAPRERRA